MRFMIVLISALAVVVLSSALDCFDNTQCEGTDTPLCVDGTCAECEYDGDQNCPPGSGLCIDGRCFECDTDPSDTSQCRYGCWNGRCGDCDDSPDCGWWFPGLGGADCENGFCTDGWAACFSGRSVVQVQGQEGFVRMDKLKIGDYVLVRDGTYSRVHSFGHYQPNRQIEFLKILTNDTATGMNEDPLEVSSDHLLYISTTNLAKNKREEKLVPAGDIKIGDCLISTNGGLARVVALNKTQARGLYSPLTTTGEIAVSGVLASNYVSRAWLKSRVSGDTLHLLQHGATTLHRVFCNWVIGNCQEEETHDEVTGFSPLVSFWYRLEQWQLRLGLIPRALFFTVLTPFAFCFILVGHIHVAPISALARYFSAALAGLLVWKMQNYKVKASKVPQVQH